MSEPLYEDSLRGLLHTSLDFFYGKVSELVFFAIGSMAKQKIGPIEKRVGVFGSYSSEGIKIIDQVAKKVSELGFAALTAEGFYLPKELEFHHIEEIFPPVVKSTPLPSFVFGRQFPQLVNKAIFYLEASAATMFELDGCYAMGIPSLGFITHQNIQMKGKNCAYLHATENYSMCTASDEMLCQYFAGKVFCPFFDSENLPWLVKQLFMVEKNRLFAIKNLSQLDAILKEFLPKPRTVRYASKNEIREYCQEFMKIHRRILRKDLNYKILAIVSKKKGSLVFFEFTPSAGSFTYKLSEEPINIVLMKLPQTAFGGDLSKVEFGGTNVIRERNKLIILKGENSRQKWSLEEARNDAFKEVAAVQQMLSGGKENNSK